MTRFFQEFLDPSGKKVLYAERGITESVLGALKERANGDRENSPQTVRAIEIMLGTLNQIYRQ